MLSFSSSLGSVKIINLIHSKKNMLWEMDIQNHSCTTNCVMSSKPWSLHPLLPSCCTKKVKKEGQLHFTVITDSFLLSKKLAVLSIQMDNHVAAGMKFQILTFDFPKSILDQHWRNSGVLLSSSSQHLLVLNELDELQRKPQPQQQDNQHA